MRYELNDNEWRVIKPMLPNKSRGVPRVDDRRLTSPSSSSHPCGLGYALMSPSPSRLDVCLFDADERQRSVAMPLNAAVAVTRSATLLRSKARLGH
jgi:hypothetical protein